MDKIILSILFITIIVLIVFLIRNKKNINEKEQKIQDLNVKVSTLKNSVTSLIRTKDYLEDLVNKINEKEKKEEELQEKQLQEYYEKQYKLLNEKLLSEEKFLKEKIKNNIIDYSNIENLKLSSQLQKNKENFNTKIQEYQEKIEETKQILDEISKKQSAAIEIAKQNEEIKNQSTFYKLQISEENKEDILELKKVERFLNNKEILNKLIYKIYFEKPYTDLIGRVVGKEQKTGIYKITNTLNDKVYIGQAVNIAERWKQHIKRALGAETRTQNKLYPAMEKEGIWNFTFQIIEICDRKDLSKKEQYWQNFYGAKEYGYSIK